MWHLTSVQKLVLILVSAAMVASLSLFIICWVVSAIHKRTSKKGKEQSVLKGSLYGTSSKNGVNLTNFSLSEDLTEEDEELDHYGDNGVYGGPAGGPVQISEGTLISKLTASRQQSASSGKSLESNTSRTHRQDSSYSSMSSGRNSPSSVRSAKNVSKSEGGTSPDIIHQNVRKSSSYQQPLPCSSITVSLLLSHIKQEEERQSSEVAKLAITVESASDLPFREYRAHCDPWVAVSVLRDRRSLRRRPPASLAFFKTKTIRHAHNPFYSQTFVCDLQKSEIKDVSVRFTVMDQDRYAGPVEIGRAVVSLKEANQTVQEPAKSTINMFLSHQKRSQGDLQIGLSYLPTAQRLSISLIKATNLKFEKDDKANADKKPNAYVKFLMFNQSGRLVKKKRSAVKYETKDPFYDETINFEAEPHQLENHTIVVLVLSKREEDEELDQVCDGIIGVDLDSSDQESYYRFNLASFERNAGSGWKNKDTVLGMLYLGKKVRGDKERDHWQKMMESPRKVFTMAHNLK